MCLLSGVLLIGPAERGVSPDECRVAADNAAQCRRSSCKTLRPLTRGFPLAGLLLVVRVASLLTPCSSELQLYAAAFHRRRQCNQALRSKAGVHLGIWRVAPGEKASLNNSHS